jgi:hypothetical protein
VWTKNTFECARDDAVYVDLTRNPEGNTGFSGEEARRIWNAIYNENCFKVSSAENKRAHVKSFFFVLQR